VTTYGLTAFGFWKKPLERIVTELEEDLRAEFGDTLNTKSGPVHQLIGTFASPLAEQWELLEQAAGAVNRNSAEGALLDAIGALTGTPREAATPSTVTLTLSLDANVAVPAGSVVSRTGTPTTRFVTLTTASTMSLPAGDVTVEAECESTGPTEAPAATLTVIETPVSGWTAVTNALDASLGTDEELDEPYRVRQVAELEASGAGTIDTIRARVLRVDGVIDVLAYENRTGTEANGLPPYSFEIVVWDGASHDAAAQDIADVIWATQPATGRSFGTTSQTVVDEAGGIQLVNYSLADVTDVYLEIQCDVSTSAGWVSGIADTIKSALATWGDANLGVGDDLARSRLYSVIHGCSPSITNVTAILTGLTVSPLAAADVTIGPRAVADIDTSRIVITPNVLP